jgi:hypothetical protein
MIEKGQVLVEFLLARVAEDEKLAQAAMPGPWTHLDVDGFVRSKEHSTVLWEAEELHILAWDPVRVLAECQARRAIIDWVDKWGDDDEVLRLLVQPFKDHPDFSSGWLQD